MRTNLTYFKKYPLDKSIDILTGIEIAAIFLQPVWMMFSGA